MFKNFCLAIVIATPFHTLSWFDLGHEVVAEIAWREMDDKTKDELKLLLATLTPHYKEASSFTTLAKLPDHIRSGLKAFDAWHYVNLPYLVGVDTAPPHATPNAIWALCESVRSLGITKAKTASDPFGWSPTSFEKAFMLSFFIHIVGDIHQPLHGISRVTRFLPQGDLGGNLFPIRLGKTISNLHFFWDTGLGFFSDVREPLSLQPEKSSKTDAFATGLMKEFPRKHFGSKIEQVAFAQWAQDSHELAKAFAYDLPEGSEPSASYIAKGQKLIKERVVLAGYRLAYLLTELLSGRGVSQLATGCTF